MASFSGLDLSKYTFKSNAKLVDFARAAEAAERYEDMCKIMTHLVQEQLKNKGDISVEERNLLSVAFKNVVGSKRASWRTLTSDEFKNDELVAKYNSQIEAELETTCKEILNLLETNLIKSSAGKNDETEVFYLKMAGDYYRYLAEFKDTEGNGKNAASMYQKALDIAEKNLPPTHPIRLGLALNYSVCFYECLKNEKKACELAKKAFDDAISKLDQLDESSYKDSTLIMQLLRDNLTLWTEGDGEEE